MLDCISIYTVSTNILMIFPNVCNLLQNWNQEHNCLYFPLSGMKWLNAANILFKYFTFIYCLQNKIILLHVSSSCISWVPDNNSSIMMVGMKEIFHKNPPSEKYFNTYNFNTDFAGNAATSGDLQMAVNLFHLLWLWYEWCFAIMNQPIFLLFILVGTHSFRTNNNSPLIAHSTLPVGVRKQYLFTLYTGTIERK